MTRKNLINKSSAILGDDFEYFYDTDQIQNQIIPELECKYIHFKFKPNLHMSHNEIQTIFETKLKELQQIFLQHDINGGKAMWFGYILTIKINTTEDLKNEMTNVQTEYEQKIKKLESQLDVLKNTR
jgi:hypothetical protein